MFVTIPFEILNCLPEVEANARSVSVRLVITTATGTYLYALSTQSLDEGETYRVYVMCRDDNGKWVPFCRYCPIIDGVPSLQFDEDYAEKATGNGIIQMKFVDRPIREIPEAFDFPNMN